MSEHVLVVGDTGRDMALAKAISLSDDVEHVLCAPGNAGTEVLPKVNNVNLQPLDVDSITQFVREYPKELLVIVGPRGPQTKGLGDRLRSHDIPVVSSSAAASELERSKIFATSFMERYDIPHPLSTVATTVDEALNALAKDASTQVIKANGPAYGQGVVLPQSRAEAIETVQAMFLGKRFGTAAKQGIVIQERLTGPERSVFVMCGNQNYSIVPFIARDYKRLEENDTGPNTGGMGSYAQGASQLMNPQQWEEVCEIVDKTIYGMANMGTPFQGILYVGLLLAKEYNDRPIVLEYNTRFGDPEAQVILPLLTDAGFDMHAVFREAASGRVMDLTTHKQFGKTALAVCLLAQGFPYNPQPGATIFGLDRIPAHTEVYHTNTSRGQQEVWVSGPRALDIIGMSHNTEAAAKIAYAAIGTQGIHFNGMHYRRDIGSSDIRS